MLRGEQTVLLREERTGAGRSARSSSRTPVAEQLGDEDARIFDALRAWRARTAKEQSVPAYVVLHDSTLRELAVGRPTSIEGLVGVSGIGDGKRERYGEGILETIAAAEADASA